MRYRETQWYRGGWTKRWIAWLRERAGGLDQFVGPVLEGLIDRFEVDRNEMTKLERHIRELADTSRYADAHDELRKLLGVGLLTE